MIESTDSRARWWRVLHYPLTRLAVASAWLILVVTVLQMALRGVPGRKTPPGLLLSATAIVLAAYGAYRVYVRLVERRAATELGRAGALSELGLGVAAGVILFTATIGPIWALGYYTVTGTRSWTAAIPALAIAAQSGVSEEIFFRGIVFRITEEWAGTWLALLASALLFGALHLLNPNATLLAGVAIALEAGVMLAAAYILTRRLWLAIGIHFAWNFTQGGIFGVAISGYQASGILQGRLSGPELLSGGAFGVEASFPALVLGLAASALLLWRVRAKNGVVAPSWVELKERTRGEEKKVLTQA